jgi:hypothetical protein
MAAVARGRSDFDFLQSRPEGAPASLEGFLSRYLPVAAPGRGRTREDEIMQRNWARASRTRRSSSPPRTGQDLVQIVTWPPNVEREAVRPTIAR